MYICLCKGIGEAQVREQGSRQPDRKDRRPG